MKFKLRFPVSAIERWAEAFSDPSDSVIEKDIAPAARRQGYLTRDQFLRIAEWKTVRSRARCRKNEAEYVKEVTRAALSSKNERFKVQALRLLDGVEWPTASVILHFCDRGCRGAMGIAALHKGASAAENAGPKQGDRPGRQAPRQTSRARIANSE